MPGRLLQLPHDNHVILKKIVKPTVVAQARVRRRFLEFLNHMVNQNHDFLRLNGYSTSNPKDVLDRGAQVPLKRMSNNVCTLYSTLKTGYF